MPTAVIPDIPTGNARINGMVYWSCPKCGQEHHVKLNYRSVEVRCINKMCKRTYRALRIDPRYPEQ